MPKRWAQPRSTVSLLEKPTLRRLQQKRMNIAAQLKEIPAIAADRTNIPWDIMRSLGMVSRHIKKWQRKSLKETNPMLTLVQSATLTMVKQLLPLQSQRCLL